MVLALSKLAGIQHIQYRSGFLNKYESIYFKICLVLLTIISRFVNIYLNITLLFTNTLLLIYIGAGKILLAVSFIWITLSIVIISIDFLFSTLTLEVFINLIYGFSTFTALSLFYLTTPPKHIEKLIGFNIFTLTYLFLNYYIVELTELVSILKARGWDPGFNVFKYKYVLRIVTVFLITRINEAIDILRTRGVD